MRIDPALAALRDDPTPVVAQSLAAADALEAWRTRKATRAVLDALGAYGAGRPLSGCPALDDATGAGAFGFAGGVVAILMEAMRSGPLGQPRMVASSIGAMHRLTLAASGRAALSLALVDGDALARGRKTLSARAVFQPGETRLTVLSGRGKARIVRLSGADERRRAVSAREIALQAGERLVLDSGCEALDLLGADHALVTLRLHRRADGAEPIREYELGSGELVHQSAGDPRESRLALAASLLGRMKRRDAVPALAELVRGDGSAQLRWHALREALALDTAEGFRLLLAVADRTADPLAAPARSLARDLSARYPRLAIMEDLPCPA